MRLSRKLLASLATLIVALVCLPAGALAATGSISGTVTGAGGSPVSGARVCPQSTSSTIGGGSCATTNAAGEYTIGELAEGTYLVRFERSGEYLAQWYPAAEKQSRATAVSVTGGATTGGIDAELRKGGAIEGVVTDATSGAGLGQIRACAMPVVQGAVESQCALTDAEGRYRIVGLAGAEYRVRLEPEYPNGDLDYLTQYYPDVEIPSEGTTFPVTDGATVSGVDAAMHLGGSIAGRVVNEGAQPIQGVTVCAYPVLGPESFSFCIENSATTAADGTYRIRGVPSGEYKVRFYGDASYLPQFFPDRPTRGAGSAVTVSGTATTAGVDATLHTGGTITGTLLEAGGEPIPYASICAHRVGTGEVNCAQAKPDGEYSILTLATGEYEVEFANQNNSTDSPFVTTWYGGGTDRAAATRLHVTAGAVVSGIDGEVARGGTISGKVTDAVSGEPASGIWVCAYSDGEVVGRCDTTHAAGEYTIVGLPAGSYAVHFKSAGGGFEQDFLVGNPNYTEQFDGGVADEADATLVSAGPGIAKTGVDAAMSDGGGIAGTITGPLGEPLEDSIACVVTSAQQLGESCGTTNAAGEYKIQGLYPGAYTVRFWGNQSPTNLLSGQYFHGVPNFDEAEPVTVVGTGVTTGIDARLTPGGRIEGTVTDAYDRSPLVGVGVCSEGADGIGGLCVETEAGGHYSMPLAAGSYVLHFTYGYTEAESEVAEFVPQYFDGATEKAGATAVTVASGATTPSIDAALQPTGGRVDQVSVATTGSGVVTSSPAGIDCGATCSNGFETRKTVTLHAEPSAGATFTGWTGACSGSGPCQIRLTDAAEVAATFESSAETPGTQDQGSSTQSTNAPGPADTTQTVPPKAGPQRVTPRPEPKPKRECKKGFKEKKVGKTERCVKAPKKHHGRKHRAAHH